MKQILLIAFLLYAVGRSYAKAATDIQADVRPMQTPQGLQLAVKLTNPNINPFYISAADLFVSIGVQRIPVGRVQVTQPVLLAPYDSVEFTPTIDVNSVGLQTAINQVPLNEPVKINVEGTVEIGPLVVPLDFTVEYAM